MTETLTDLKREFQLNRQKELELLRRVTGAYVPDYRVDDPQLMYLKNVPQFRRAKNRVRVPYVFKLTL